MGKAITSYRITKRFIFKHLTNVVTDVKFKGAGSTVESVTYALDGETARPWGTDSLALAEAILGQCDGLYMVDTWKEGGDQ